MLDRSTPSQRRSDRRTARQIPYKTMESLEELIAAAAALHGECTAIQTDIIPPAMDRAAEKYMDPVLVRRIASISRSISSVAEGLARIERVAREAREGQRLEDAPIPFPTQDA